MSCKPENTFRGSIHKLLPRDLYHVKMSNPYAGGIPDDFYSGSKNDLWIEYKFIPKITPALCALPDLSPLQLEWLNERYKEGRNVAVITGCKKGGVLHLNREWEQPRTPDEFKRLLRSRDELARWIAIFTKGAS